MDLLENIMVESLAGILIASLALLLTLLKDFILPSIFKPRLELIGEDNGQCVVDASNEFNQPSRWIRLKLKNKNSFWTKKAKNCYVKLLEIRNSKGDKISPIDPCPLMWVTYEDYKGNLAIGESHLIDLTHEYPTVRYLNFKIPIPLEIRRRAEIDLGPGMYSILVGVYGDNFSPIYKKFKVKLTNSFGELNFA